MQCSMLIVDFIVSPRFVLVNLNFYRHHLQDVRKFTQKAHTSRLISVYIQVNNLAIRFVKTNMRNKLSLLKKAHAIFLTTHYN